MKCSASSVNATSIDFNVLIPLFNVYDWELNTQNPHYYDLQSDEEYSGKIDSATSLVIDSGGTKNHYDIPLGIWISDKLISLDRSSTTPGAYRPSWSLCISSQFKPFPYSNKYPDNISESDNLDIYGTFAMIMSKQGLIANEFETITTSITNITHRIDNITNIVNTIINEGVGGNGGGSGSGSGGENIDDYLNNINTRLDNQGSLIGTIGTSVNELKNDVSALQNSDFIDKNYLEQQTYITASVVAQNYASKDSVDSLSSTVTAVSSNNATIITKMQNITNYMQSYTDKIDHIVGIGESINGSRIEWDNNNKAKLAGTNIEISLRETTVGYMSAYTRLYASVKDIGTASSNAVNSAETATAAFSKLRGSIVARLQYLQEFLTNIGGFNFINSNYYDNHEFYDLNVS